MAIGTDLRAIKPYLRIKTTLALPLIISILPIHKSVKPCKK
jgi:hypothetical protein